MVLKRSSSFVLLFALAGAWINTGCDNNNFAHAVPISKLLARQQDLSSAASSPIPSPGRIQIKHIVTPPPPPSFRRSDPSKSHVRHNNNNDNDNDNDNVDDVPESSRAQVEGWYEIDPRRRPFDRSAVSSPSLHGHVVIDDEDDDDGNELLDTELDGLLRPDEDDEIEGTIEGQVLEEEEEDDGQEEEDDDEADIEAEVARIRELYSLDRIGGRRMTSRDAAALRALDEEEAEMIEEIQDQAEEDDENEEEEEDWLTHRGYRDIIPDDFDEEESAGSVLASSSSPSHTTGGGRFQVVVSRFGGKAAAADLAAGLD
ncbi:hypothetical protein BG004_001580 [Podila humilis]|nr:hypothetical protein BG004_001580 [Podila humilis]